MNNKKLELLMKQNTYHTFLIAAYALLPLETNQKHILLFLYLLITAIDVIKTKKGEK